MIHKSIFTHTMRPIVFIHLHPTLHVTKPQSIVRSPREDTDASILIYFKPTWQSVLFYVALFTVSNSLLLFFLHLVCPLWPVPPALGLITAQCLTKPVHERRSTVGLGNCCTCPNDWGMLSCPTQGQTQTLQTPCLEQKRRHQDLDCGERVLL